MGRHRGGVRRGGRHSRGRDGDPSSAGAHAVPAPLAETGALAGWLLSLAGLPLGTGPLTIVPGDGPRHGRTPRRHPVRHRRARCHGPGVPRRSSCCFPKGPDGRSSPALPSGATIEPGTNIAGEPRDRVHFDSTPVVDEATVDVDPGQLQERGALTRVTLAAGALQRVSDLTVSYTSERVQFGRPVARFQLVQAHLVHLAQDAALLSMAADAAVRAASSGSGRFEIAAARALAHSASASGARAAHQAHGAMGMTREYPLHHLTRRLWAWQHEYGGTAPLGGRVAAHAMSVGADRLYPLVTG